ncbi:hypothetical protein CDAR_99341 [Caerostris darwini]|uniref:Uncharacterized protein n=1 Tax=Caerostris darwini TaxID=1538125 RepID=A0AAV4Q5L2_9ARAC|nr:hypothetical protein CDAR_99341 [Caerostris darwini]
MLGYGAPSFEGIEPCARAPLFSATVVPCLPRAGSTRSRWRSAEVNAAITGGKTKRVRSDMRTYGAMLAAILPRAQCCVVLRSLARLHPGILRKLRLRCDYVHVRNTVISGHEKMLWRGLFRESEVLHLGTHAYSEWLMGSEQLTAVEEECPGDTRSGCHCIIGENAQVAD